MIPTCIFLDEPTTGFDPEARRRLWTAVENLRGLGKTILLTTHYLDEAERLADRIAILRHGQGELTGTPHDVATIRARRSFISPRMRHQLTRTARRGDTQHVALVRDVLRLLGVLVTVPALSLRRLAETA